MDKQINYKQQFTMKEIQQMYKDLEDIVGLIENQNEALTYKLRVNRSIFASFIKGQIITNNIALGCMLKYYKLLADTMDDYFVNSNEKDGGRG